MIGWIGGLSVEEAAAVLDISVGNVRVLSHRGLNRLNGLLNEQPSACAEIVDLPLSPEYSPDRCNAEAQPNDLVL